MCKNHGCDFTHDSLFPKEDVDHCNVFFPGVVLVVIPDLEQNNYLTSVLKKGVCCVAVSCK